MKILLDNSIIRDAEFSEPDQVTKKIVWGNQEHEYTLPGYRKRKSRSDTGGWRQKQINCLPTIGRLIRENALKAYMTPEIHFEWMKGSMGPRLANVLTGCDFDEIAPAIDRSYFQKMALGKFIGKETFIQFCALLLKLNSTQIDVLLSSPFGQKLPEQQKDSLRNVKIFRKICHGISETHYPDAFHLWTAEVHGLDYFLSNDKKFQNVVRNNRNAVLRAHPVSPAELLEIMGVTDVDETPLEKDVFYTLVGQEIRNEE